MADNPGEVTNKVIESPKRPPTRDHFLQVSRIK